MCYAITIFELTSGRILSLLSPNSNTSNSDISGTITPWMLRAKELHTQFRVKTVFSNHARTGRNAYGGLLQVYGNVHTGRDILFKVFRSPFYLESWPFHVLRSFLQSVFQHSIGSTRHRFFLHVGSIFQVNKHCLKKRVMNIILFLRNRGSVKAGLLK